VSEAPRGLLYHGYQLDSTGVIQSATIVPPSSQNQATIEDDLRSRRVRTGRRYRQGQLPASEEDHRGQTALRRAILDPQQPIDAVVRSANRTLVLISGGTKASDEAMLDKARQSMQAGITGLIFGAGNANTMNRCASSPRCARSSTDTPSSLR
jgi:hypothetical protein